jgi:hypothetical protein
MHPTNPTDWLREFLREYRKIYKKLTPEDRSKRKFDLCDFSPICEIHWIWLVNPNIQILAVRHLSTENTDELYVYGPISYDEAPERLEEILSSPPFLQRLTLKESERFLLTEEEAIFRTPVEGFLLNVFNNPPSHTTVAASKEEPIVTSMTTLGGSNFAWLIVGDLSELSPPRAAEKMFPSLAPERVSQPEAVQAEEAELVPNAIAKGYGTYFYPPVWIGDSRGETFKDKTASGLMRRASEVVLSTTYRERPMFVTTAGFVAVVCKTKEVACQLLNELMLGAIFEGLSAHTVHLREIGNIEVDLQKGTITRTHLELVSPRTRQAPYMGSQLSLSLSLYYQRVDTEQLKRALAKAEKLAKTIPSEWISLFLAGYTHYENLEYTQSFLMLWLIVEQYVHALWSNLINSVPKKRKDKFLRVPSYWSVDHSIELLNLMKCLSQSEYNALMAFKKKRNDIVHTMRFVDKQDTESLLNYVADMFRSRLA